MFGGMVEFHVLRRQFFVLICDAWVSKNPVQDCGPEDLRIDDATLPDRLARLF
jgi:hypothetical protein